MLYSLPQLPYSYDALEPYIDAKTMEIHHTRHHQAYVDNLCKALDQAPELYKRPLEYVLLHVDELPSAIKTSVQNNGGGHYNHSLFWQMMKKNGGGKPTGELGKEIAQQFGSFDAFQEQFNTAAKSRFGSGWAWLVVNKQGNLEIISTANQDAPLLFAAKPILGLDVWEHAYYLKYQNKRVDYIAAWWHVVNWDFCATQFNK